MQALRSALWLLLFSALAGTSSQTILLAQSSSTSLRGTVADSSGALIPGAIVTLQNKATGFTATQTATSSGLYQFPQLAPGTYDVTTTAPGFADAHRRAELLVNQPATVNITLSVGGTAETVNVSAATETLNSTDASIGNAMDNQYIQSVPTEGRNVPDLLSVQPGVLYLGRNVSQDTDSRSGAVAGARSDQGNVTLDGMDDNDQLNGYAFTGVLRSTQDSTEEFRVTTANSNADQGRSSGAQVSLVTKSGTNAFHGSAYEYYRPPFGAANDWFYKQSELQGGQPNIASKILRNTFGAALGGPIKKDKLFFFFNYEGQRTAENLVVTQIVPTASYRAGSLAYSDANGGTTTLTPSQVGALDASVTDNNGNNCSVNGTCPWGPGADPNVLSYFAQYPLPNNSNTGDALNTAGYTFSSPAPATLNTTILKLDYSPNDRHRIFARGNLQKDYTAGSQQFPGQPFSSITLDNTKGLAAGHTWSISSHLVNDLRYGYVRQGFSNRGIGAGSYVDFRFINQFQAETRTSTANVPVHNIIDNLSWSKGNHSVQVGGNWRLVTNTRSTDSFSYNNASTNPYWLNNEPDPSSLGGSVPTYSSGFTNSFLIAYADLVGTVPQLNQVYNYSVSPGGSGAALLPQGAMVPRSYRNNEFEYYLEDSWRALPNLTITYGVRHTILQTPYEVHGQEVAPTINTDSWFRQREAAAQVGSVYEEPLAFVPAGKANHAPGYWSKQKLNLAPRLAIAYTPDGKTSIRAGFGLYFDHYGQGIVNTFSQEGSFGLSMSFTNPAASFGTADSPRFTGKRGIPAIDAGGPALGPVTYPYTPAGGFLITWGIDNKLKTPYSEVMDASVQRQLPGGNTLEVDYVGRLGRHLLQQIDLAEPVDFVDTKGGGDYFHAAAQLSALVDQNGGDSSATVPTIPYFEDVFPNLAQGGLSATQFIYSNEWAPYRYTYGETTSLADIDFFCYYGCPDGSKFWQPQFSSLYSFATIGMSYYNAAQLILRHPMSHGLQYDFNYTFSKSIDMGSDAERGASESGNGSFSEIQNTWNPSLNRGVSDFDTRHLISWDWVYQLPFGRGARYLTGVNRLTDLAIGGWQFGGLGRWSSALPFSVFEPGYTTDWEFSSYGVNNTKIKLRKHLDANGTPQVFADPDAINNGVRSSSGPIRLPYPGESGNRNPFRGDGFFELDSSLSKSWALYHESKLRFSWEGFNATNSVRYDTNPNTSLGSGLSSGSLGKYSAVLNRPRVLQFSLRLDF